MQREEKRNSEVEHLRKQVSLGFQRVAWLYFGSSFIQLILEVIFLVLQLKIFGISVPEFMKCQHRDCVVHIVDCFISRPMEKTIFLNIMLTCSVICILLNLMEMKSVLLIRWTQEKVANSSNVPTSQNHDHESPTSIGRTNVIRMKNVKLWMEDERNSLRMSASSNQDTSDMTTGQGHQKDKRKRHFNVGGRNCNFSDILLESECAGSRLTSDDEQQSESENSATSATKPAYYLSVLQDNKNEESDADASFGGSD